MDPEPREEALDPEDMSDGDEAQEEAARQREDDGGYQ